eukprot:441125-Amphidinium_carterae.1
MESSLWCIKAGALVEGVGRVARQHMCSTEAIGCGVRKLSITNGSDVPCRDALVLIQGITSE